MGNLLKFYSNKSDLYFNLYNPVFCGDLLRVSITKYQNDLKKPMPILLSFLILPLVLRKEIRKSIIPQKNLHSWILENQYNIIDLNEKISELIDVTKSSIIFLLQSKIVTLEKDATLNIVEPKNVERFSNISEGVREYYQKARTISSWFASIDDLPTIFSLLGVKP